MQDSTTTGRTLKCLSWSCAMFLASTVSTYSQWELRYPHQYDYAVTDFQFIDAKHGFYATANGVINATNDSSRTWRTSAYIEADKFLSISFADSNHGIAYSPYSYLNDQTSQLLTTDGGVSWTRSNALPSGNLVLGAPRKSQLLFFNDATALATFDNGNILRSGNTLQSWRTVRQNRSFFPSDYGVPFGWITSFCKLKNGTLLAVGNDMPAYQYGAIKDSVSYILKSGDGGNSWESLWRGSKESMSMISFVDSVKGWMCGDSGLYRTADGGASWVLQKQSLYAGYPPVAIATCDTETIYAIDQLGQFYSSSNDGGDWQTRYCPVGSNTKIQFLSKSEGYVGGSSGLYKTTNAGATWTKQTGSYAGRLDKAIFPDAKTGYAIVDLSLNKTTDGGYSWSVLPESRYAVYDISAVDSADLWMTRRDTVLHSTDGGVNWTRIHFDSAYVQKVYFYDHDFGILFDVWASPESYSAECVIVTTDGGSTWKRYALPRNLYGFRKMFFISKNEGWFDSEFALYHTIDGGVTWEVILRGEYGNQWNHDAFAFDFVDAQHGWFAYYNVVYKTDDGGKNWIRGNLPYDVEIKDMKFINMNAGFAVGQKGRIFSTTDGGATWTTEQAYCPYDLFSLSAVKLGKSVGMRIGGDAFTILARDITTEAEEEKVLLPESHFLSLNYPNPFNPSTTIGFGVPGEGNGSAASHPGYSWVRLAVYDCLGREVAVLVNERKAPGSYEVRYDASRLASGVYYYRIQSGDFLATRRMVLLK